MLLSIVITNTVAFSHINKHSLNNRTIPSQELRRHTITLDIQSLLSQPSYSNTIKLHNEIETAVFVLPRMNFLGARRRRRSTNEHNRSTSNTYTPTTNKSAASIEGIPTSEIKSPARNSKMTRKMIDKDRNWESKYLLNKKHDSRQGLYKNNNTSDYFMEIYI